jgi:hypothetical protein
MQKKNQTKGSEKNAGEERLETYFMLRFSG